jgi:hypothetical protein
VARDLPTVATGNVGNSRFSKDEESPSPALSTRRFTMCTFAPTCRQQGVETDLGIAYAQASPLNAKVVGRARTVWHLHSMITINLAQ